MVANAWSWLGKIAPYITKPVAQIATPLPNNSRQPGLGNLISDAMRVVGGGDLAIMNSGGIRQGLAAGTVTYAQLFEVQPFGNTLVRVRVRGSDLRSYFSRALAGGAPNFRISGARIVYHAGGTPGIDSLTVLGNPLDDRAIYTVVLNDFSANGGDRLGFGSAAISTTAVGVVDLDALIAYLGSLPQPVSAPTEQRLVLRP
jgi:2',3'-cyclic-nucleotide 2'-phosphodiesterase (5'-nucleotidase family)